VGRHEHIETAGADIVAAPLAGVRSVGGYRHEQLTPRPEQERLAEGPWLADLVLVDFADIRPRRAVELQDLIGIAGVSPEATNIQIAVRTEDDALRPVQVVGGIAGDKRAEEIAGRGVPAHDLAPAAPHVADRRVAPTV